MEISRDLYIQANKSLKLLPCFEKMNDEEYAKFLADYKANPNLYGKNPLKEILTVDQFNRLDNLLDQSNGYTPLLNGIAKANFEHLIIEGQDHDFSKDVYDFKRLPEEYLFNNILAKGGKKKW